MSLDKHLLRLLFRSSLILPFPLSPLNTWSCGVRCDHTPLLFRWTILANPNLRLVIPFLKAARKAPVDSALPKPISTPPGHTFLESCLTTE
ncbi:hypothetical protein EV426DRAFT_27682 [Tirmania nivea]|nr:hypothetical protein EV426DRAFT_27682 [Tirmania nivea]